MNKLIKDSITKFDELEKKENEEDEKETLKFAREIFGEEYLDHLKYCGPRHLKIIYTDFELHYWSSGNCFLLEHPSITEIPFDYSIRSLEDLGRAIKYSQKKIDDLKTKSKFHSIKKFLGIGK